MKLNNKFFGAAGRIITLTLALVITFTMFCPVTAEAKTNKVNPKYQEFTTSTNVAKKKAAVIKTGTSLVTLKKKGSTYDGYLRFVAPKTKTYSITMSNIKGNKGGYCNGSVGLMVTARYNAKYLTFTNVYVKGKATTFMYLENRDTKSHRGGGFPTVNTGKIKLKKGQSVYMRYHCLSSNNKNKTVATKFVIK